MMIASTEGKIGRKFADRLEDVKAYASMIFSGAVMLFAVVNAINGGEGVSVRVITVLAVSCGLVMIAGFRGTSGDAGTSARKYGIKETEEGRGAFMKKFIDGVVAVKTSACMIFSGTIILFSIINALSGKTDVPIKTIASLAVLAIFCTFVQMVAFTDIFIKNLSYVLRMAVFFVPVFAIFAAVGWLFKWFPAEVEGMVTFGVIFLIVFAGATVGFEIYYKMSGRKYDGLLGEYRKNKEREN
ncbi:MAG: DUF3021 domain-containing protein [Clostridiales bacterium]|jgi:hypothetical protein|nr:DUF3021 domain-containing protein [Clostridiales bacterium]